MATPRSPFSGRRLDGKPETEPQPERDDAWIEKLAMDIQTEIYDRGGPSTNKMIEMIREAHAAECPVVDDLLDDAFKILEGFDKAVFVRNIKGDGDPAWAIKLLPYLQAIGRLEGARVARAALAGTEKGEEASEEERQQKPQADSEGRAERVVQDVEHSIE